MSKTSQTAKYVSERIVNIIEFIHQNLHLTLSVEQVAEHSCWSRWQLQRVFQHETGMTVANYIRELKLSQAAEQLLDGEQRIIDIALASGFNSEVSFSRAFKQMFGQSPRSYRKSKLRTGLRKPLQVVACPATPLDNNRLIEVRIQSRQSFAIEGFSAPIRGLFALKPDFHIQVPKMWFQLGTVRANAINQGQAIGVADLTQMKFDCSNIHYWAGIILEGGILNHKAAQLPVLLVPAQTYAVLTHRGDIAELPKSLEWFITHWLPRSGYRGIDSYELEWYPPNYLKMGDEAVMEYWLPIVPTC